MKAIVRSEYGGPEVLRLEEVAPPTPGEGEVLVRVRAAALNPLDRHTTRGEPYLLRLGMGLGRPKERGLGVDLAGTVESVGAGVERWRPGDEVFGAGKYALAERACARADRLAPKPARIGFEEAAAIPVAGLTALQGLRDRGRLQAGQRVLVVGAAGGVGTFAVQIAKALGADVTGVCGPTKVETVRSLGADAVIDYTREDFTRGGGRYDLILDVAGTRTLRAGRRALTPRGTYVVVGGPAGRWLRGPDRFLHALLLSLVVRQRILPFVSVAKPEDLATLAGLVDSGRLRPLVDRTYPLAATADALRRLEDGHSRGKLVVVP